MTRRQPGTLMAIKQTLIATATKRPLKIAQRLDIRAVHQYIHKIKQARDGRFRLRFIQQFLKGESRIGHDVSA